MAEVRALEAVDVVGRHHAAVGVVGPLRHDPCGVARIVEIADGDQLACEIGQAPPGVVAGVVVDEDPIIIPSPG